VDRVDVRDVERDVVERLDVWSDVVGPEVVGQGFSHCAAVELTHWRVILSNFSPESHVINFKSLPLHRKYDVQFSGFGMNDPWFPFAPVHFRCSMHHGTSV